MRPALVAQERARRAASEVRVLGALGAIGSTWLTQWDRSPWRILSREWRRLTSKGLGEECRWKWPQEQAWR